MESLILTDATIFTGEEVLENYTLWLEAGKIRRITCWRTA